MAIDSGFQINAGGSAARAKRVYPTIRAGLYPMQLIDISPREENAYQSTTEKVMKLSFAFVVVAEGPAYGARFWQNVTPTLSRASGEGQSAKKESNMHKVLKALMNGGEDLSDAQIKDFQENSVARLRALYDPKAEGYQPRFVEGLVTLEPTKEKGEDGKPIKKNKLGTLTATDETYAPYVQRITLDPRNEGEDESITCQFGEFTDGEDECDRIVRGWVKSNGEWYSQADWVKYQEDKFGGHYCVEHMKTVKKELADPDKAPF